MNASKLLIVVYILLLTITWGLSWPLIKIGLQYMGPFTFSYLRFLIGGLSLLLFLVFFQNTKSSLKGADWAQLIVLGFLQTFAVFGLITYALMFVDAGKTSIILYTMPIWSSILASVFLNEKITRQNVIGLILGICGLVFIIGNDFLQTASPHSILSIVLILLSALCWALATVYFRLKFSNCNQLAVNAYQMLIGAIGLFIIALLFENEKTIVWNAESIFSLVFTGIAASALCFSLWYYLLRIINTVTATISTMLVPVFGVIFGKLLLNESLTLTMVIGGCCILTGIFVSQVRLNKNRIRKLHNPPKQSDTNKL